MRGIAGLTGTMPSGMIRGGSASWQVRTFVCGR